MFENLGHYKILDRIGAGGMGEVFRARDTRLGRTVALKVIAAPIADDAERRDRFVHDAHTAATLSHPNIAALYEIGEDQGHLFLAFEFVPGETLASVIAGRPLNPRRTIDLAVQIADALADAHAVGITHRDIKPGNVIVTPKGNAKILDFGFAAWTAGGAERIHAATAATVMVAGAATTRGTVTYMSPEQALGEAIDHRTDIFSLGIVVFEMLTGRLPFSGSTSTAVSMQIVQAPAPPPSTINRSLPAEFDPIVAKALAKRTEDRYESAVTLSAELRSVGAILDVRSDTAEPPARRGVTHVRRRRVAPMVILLLVLMALATVAWLGRDTIAREWRRLVGPRQGTVLGVMPTERDARQADSAES